MKLFELFATLGLDSNEFDNNIDASVEKGEGARDKLSGAFSAIKTAITIAGIAVAVKAIGDSFTNAAAAADKVDKASQTLGMSRKGYQEWGYVLSQNGSSIDTMSVSMKTMQNAIAQGTKATDDAFAKLGLNADELKNMSTEDAFGAVVTALQGMPAGAEKTALAMDLLGKNAMELMPLLNGTAESTEGLKQEANDLGLVLSDDAVDSGVAFTDAMDTLKRTMSAAGTSLITGLMPSITKLIDKITPLLARILPKLTKAFGKIFEALEPVGDFLLDVLVGAIEWVADNIDTLIPIVGALGAAFLVLNIIMNANPFSLIVIGIAAVIAGIVLLVKNFDSVTEWLGQIGAWIYDNVISPVVRFFVGLWTTVSGAASDAWDAIVAVWELVATWFDDNIITPVGDFFANLWTDVSSAASDAWDAIVAVWELVSTWFNDNVIVPVSDFFAGLWSAVTTAATDTWDAIVAVWTVVSAWFTDNIITPVSSAFSKFWLTISSLFSTLWGWIKGVWVGANQWFNDTVITPIANAFTAFWDGIKNAAKNTWDAIVEWIAKAIDDIKTFLGLQGKASYNSGVQDTSGNTIYIGTPPGAVQYSTGLDYVPSKGAYHLDPGEAVLTKLEADNWRKGGQQSVVGATAQDIASAIASAMQNVRVMMDGNTVGTLVASTVSSVIGETAQTLRYV